MQSCRMEVRSGRARVLVWAWLLGAASGLAGEDSWLNVGLAVRDITPELPIRLAGYAGRKRPADKLDQPLRVQALALQNATGDAFVFVALDNLGVSRAFMQPVREQLAARHALPPGAVAVVASHTHSGPVLQRTLTDMVDAAPAELERIAAYSRLLQERLVEVVGAALADCRPARLEYGLGRAGFAMNRRVYGAERVVFGDNPDGPADHDVPVLRICDTRGAVRAVLFGYACHGTSVRSGDDWYTVSGDYMGYARQLLEAHQPGAVAVFLTGMGADADPSPRGQLLHARQHGLELAGAVMGVLGRPMRPVRGGFQWAYTEVDLPLVSPPDRARLEQDAQSGNTHVKKRALAYKRMAEAGQPWPAAVSLPVAVLRLGDELTIVLMGGEVVVDYAKRIKRQFADRHPWPVGYAYEVPCYIPSARVLKEGGYEVEDSMIYYGFYGPFRGEIEARLFQALERLLADVGP